jgi:hypothetical protein
VKNRTRIIISVAVVVFAVLLAGCQGSSTAKSTQQNDQAASAAGLGQLQKAQPTPNFGWSQLRQNLIDIETAQANTVQTTSFFFNQGVASPIFSCPSIGYPIPADSELTNPDQIIHGTDSDNPSQVVSQAEVTGIYTGPTTGTHVICVDPSGHGYDNYWEGFVSTVTGPATWDASKGSIVLTGPPTAAFATKK